MLMYSHHLRHPLVAAKTTHGGGSLLWLYFIPGGAARFAVGPTRVNPSSGGLT
jgi:hypothetical protein